VVEGKPHDTNQRFIPFSLVLSKKSKFLEAVCRQYVRQHVQECDAGKKKKKERVTKFYKPKVLVGTCSVTTAVKCPPFYKEILNFASAQQKQKNTKRNMTHSHSVTRSTQKAAPFSVPGTSKHHAHKKRNLND
jgi:hypothetical protein